MSSFVNSKPKIFAIQIFIHHYPHNPENYIYFKNKENMHRQNEQEHVLRHCLFIN